MDSRPPPGGPALPVLLWFHGGGFAGGSGGWDWYDGRDLPAAGGIVVVTADYRLGPLGHLYLPELGVENPGVQDQAAALAWVRRDIAGFGGDPGAVTVGGRSAGAFAALYLAVSPVTGPYVSRVIAQSGPFGLVPQRPEEAAEHARRHLSLLGLASDRDSLTALRAVPAERLLAADQRLSQGRVPAGRRRPADVPRARRPRDAGDVAGRGGRRPPRRQAVAGRPTTRDEMTAFFAFDPRIRAITADEARARGRSGRRRRRAVRPHGRPAPGRGPERRPGSPTSSAPSTPTPAAPCSARSPAAVRALGDVFSRAAATFAATGRPAADRWHTYEPDGPATVRHFA